MNNIRNFGTGNREESGNIRLEYYDRNHEDKSLPFFGGDDTIREILGTTPALSASKEEIKDFYERNTDNATRTEYIKVSSITTTPAYLKTTAGLWDTKHFRMSPLVGG